MDAGAEGHVGAGVVPQHVELVGVFELAAIAVRSREAQHHPGALGQRDPGQGGVFGNDAEQALHR